ncbi:HPP family protein [Streptomyces laurentii]|uniref:HPP family protein n=1 Tax=Streptomyces laurentii TaxID=39478 RepID=UPI003684E10C
MPTPRHHHPNPATTKIPPRPKPTTILTNTLTATLALTTLATLGTLLHQPLLIPPLAATAALLYGAPQLPLSQPRNVIGGQLISALTGYTTLTLTGTPTPYTAALAGALALTTMTLTRTNHSPAAATAIITVTTQPPTLPFLTTLTLSTLTLTLITTLRPKIDPTTPTYPQYWW